jgi:hypothetical protein
MAATGVSPGASMAARQVASTVETTAAEARAQA